MIRTAEVVGVVDVDPDTGQVVLANLRELRRDSRYEPWLELQCSYGAESPTTGDWTFATLLFNGVQLRRIRGHVYDRKEPEWMSTAIKTSVTENDVKTVREAVTKWLEGR